MGSIDVNVTIDHRAKHQTISVTCNALHIFVIVCLCN